MSMPRSLSILALFIVVGGCSPAEPQLDTESHLKHPYLFHLVQADLWQKALDEDSVYFPPTYGQDGFTHATANPELLLNVANHFYREVPGKWLCLRMTTQSVGAANVEVVFEGTAPVGDVEANFPGTDDELFPHILGGIHPSAVLETHGVERSPSGEFLSVNGVTDDA